MDHPRRIPRSGEGSVRQGDRERRVRRPSGDHRHAHDGSERRRGGGRLSAHAAEGRRGPEPGVLRRIRNAERKDPAADELSHGDEVIDILALLGALFDLTSAFPGRVTVKDRYEMKKKVRELKRREKLKRRTQG